MWDERSRLVSQFCDQLLGEAYSGQMVCCGQISGVLLHLRVLALGLLQDGDVGSYGDSSSGLQLKGVDPPLGGVRWTAQLANRPDRHISPATRRCHVVCWARSAAWR